MKIYNELFNDDEKKATAFDKIAELYYDRNFGSVSKADLDTLMFSLYIEKILEQSEDDMDTYSDYVLSKQLGITQSKVKNLKIKKELKYPYSDFDWSRSFARVCKNARYENEKIIINISDPNLFIELKHFVELRNGTVDITLNSNLFITSIDMFVELLVYIGMENDKKLILNQIRQLYLANEVNVENMEKVTISTVIKENAGKVGGEFVLKAIKECSTFLTPPLDSIVKNIVEIIIDG